jgi:MFS family permease
VRRVLALAPYRRLLVAYGLNEVAIGVAVVALAVLVYHRTGSALGATAFFVAANFAPAFISPPLVGRIDRVAVGRVLPALYAIEAVVFVALEFVARHFSLAAVLILVVADGTIALAARSLVRAATAATLKPAGLLTEGNALMNTTFSLAYLAGPALGGLVVAAASAMAALYLDAIVFAMMAVVLATAPALAAEPAADPAIEAGSRAAWRYVRTRQVLYRLLSFQTVAWLFFGMVTPVEVVLVQHTLHGTPGWYGALLSVWGGGAVVGSAIYVRWRRLPTNLLLGTGAGLVGIGCLVLAAAPTVALTLPGAAIAGIGNGIEIVALRTGIQSNVDEPWMARVMSLLESAGTAAPGAGIVLGGAIAQLASPRVTLLVSGIGVLVLTAALQVAVPARRTAEQQR